MFKSSATNKTNSSSFFALLLLCTVLLMGQARASYFLESQYKMWATLTKESFLENWIIQLIYPLLAALNGPIRVLLYSIWNSNSAVFTLDSRTWTAKDLMVYIGVYSIDDLNLLIYLALSNYVKKLLGIAEISDPVLTELKTQLSLPF